jgi:octaprenyl-diphosphate synthase
MQTANLLNLNTISAPVKGHLTAFEDAFRGVLHSEVPLAEEVVRYISDLKGKRFRPMILFQSAALHGKINDKTMSASLLVELLHTATLVHDDVVDNSALRRGSPTVNDLWDNKISVLVGDFLFSRTLTTLLDLEDQEALKIFSNTAELITEGELLQIERSHDFEMNEKTYYDLIHKKTASLIAASCQLGVLTVGGRRKDQERLFRFGENLGMAFQIRDDLLDYMGNSRDMGKPTGNDIRENKITLPLIHAINTASSADRDWILDMLDEGVRTEQQIEQVVDFVVTHDGVGYAEDAAEWYGKRAIDSLDPYPSSKLKTSLLDLIEFTINRDK